MRAIWTGSISFGLVNIPIKLYSAVEAKTVHFHEVHAENINVTIGGSPGLPTRSRMIATMLR